MHFTFKQCAFAIQVSTYTYGEKSTKYQCINTWNKYQKQFKIDLSNRQQPDVKNTNRKLFKILYLERSFFNITYFLPLLFTLLYSFLLSLVLYLTFILNPSLTLVPSKQLKSVYKYHYSFLNFAIVFHTFFRHFFINHNYQKSYHFRLKIFFVIARHINDLGNFSVKQNPPSLFFINR